MTVDEAKAKAFGSAAGTTIPKGEMRNCGDAIAIPEGVFGKALNEFVDSGGHDCVEVEITAGSLR